jgi:aspartyl-tRNA(Asn)/glutamyl-tRNA(Gln) amidotransferase subunit C
LTFSPDYYSGKITFPCPARLKLAGKRKISERIRKTIYPNGPVIMNLDDKLLDHLSILSRLEFEKNEREQIRHDLSEMLSFVDKLKEVNTGGVEPLIFMNERPNVMRQDEIKTGLSPDEALANAPDRQGNFFRVPKVLKK